MSGAQRQSSWQPCHAWQGLHCCGSYRCSCCSRWRRRRHCACSSARVAAAQHGAAPAMLKCWSPLEPPPPGTERFLLPPDDGGRAPAGGRQLPLYQLSAWHQQVALGIVVDELLAIDIAKQVDVRYADDRPMHDRVVLGIIPLYGSQELRLVVEVGISDVSLPQPHRCLRSVSPPRRVLGCMTQLCAAAHVPLQVRGAGGVWRDLITVSLPRLLRDQAVVPRVRSLRIVFGRDRTTLCTTFPAPHG
eukprot:jgi/Chlat1/1870/Chrsp141S02176